MNKTELRTIEHIIDEMVEERVKRKMKEFYDNIHREYPTLQYDLRKAAMGVTKSSFDVLMASSDGLGQSSHSYVSKFTDPNFLEQGLGLNEPVKFQMTQEDYDNGKKYSDIPVSAFDGLTSAYEVNLDRNFKNQGTYVPSPEELAKLPSYILGGVEVAYPLSSPVVDEVAVVVYKETRPAETTLNLSTEDHHDKVLADVIHLTKG